MSKRLFVNLIGRTRAGKAAAALVVLLWGAPAAALPVNLELLLLVDVSGSIDATEYNLQKQGYVNVFNDPAIQALIAGLNGVAVAYAEWSGAAQQSLEVGWTLLEDAADSAAFATAMGAASRNFNGLTAPGSAINWGAGLFANGFEGSRLLIDVSGDGSQNDGANTLAAALFANGLGIKINGLPILGSEANLDQWYLNNIVNPGGGFMIPADGFEDFETALADKIGREISEVPEPSSLVLLGVGLGLAGYRMRRRA